jgi:hypothetical protein
MVTGEGHDNVLLALLAILEEMARMRFHDNPNSRSGNKAQRMASTQGQVSGDLDTAVDDRDDDRVALRQRDQTARENIACTQASGRRSGE